MPLPGNKKQTIQEIVEPEAQAPQFLQEVVEPEVQIPVEPEVLVEETPTVGNTKIESKYPNLKFKK